MQKTIFTIICLSALMTTAITQQSFAANKNCTGSLTTTCSGTNSADTLTGNGIANRISGHNGNDLLRGGAGGDVLSGDRGNDTVYGQDGDDYLSGGPGIDILNGGNGKDTFWIIPSQSTETAMDRIENFSKSNDTIQIIDLRSSFVITSIDQLKLDPTTSRGDYILRSIDEGDNFALRIQQVGSDTDDSTVPTGATLKIKDIKFEFSNEVIQF